MRIRRPSPAAAGRRKAFTLVEVAIASLLGTIILMFIGGIWQSFGRNVTAVVAEAAMAHDARMAMEVLRRDFNGHLADSPLGTTGEAKLVGRMVAGGELRLCYDMPPVNAAADWTTPDLVVVYSLTGDQLFRTVQGQSFLVAENVTAFAPLRLVDKTRVEIDLARDGSTRNLVFIAQDQ